MRKKNMALALAAVMAISATACGNSDGPGDAAEVKEWVYVPEFLTLEGDNISYYDMQIVNDSLYWLSWNWDEEAQTSYQDICKYSLEDQSTTSSQVVWPDEGENQNISRFVFMEDGSMYAVVYSYSEDYSESKQFLVRFDGEGNCMFSQEITEQVSDSYADTIAVDSEGRLYISGDNQVWLYDEGGNYKGTVSLDSGISSWISNMGPGRDGRIYIGYSSYDGSNSSYNLSAIDFDNKKVGDTYSNAPRGNSFVAGAETDFLMHDGNTVYGYNLESQEKEELFTWLDSDINGNYVTTFGELEDGRIIAVVQDWDTGDSGVALLTRKSSEEVAQKETIVVGTMGGMYDLQSRAVKFNKSSDKYHITIKQYMDFDNYNENTWSDAITSLNNDITSNNCPDILDLSGVSIQQLASKGVFEDLNGFLEQSSSLSRSDFVENVLDAYTYGGQLISIPSTLFLQTVVGNAAQLGTESGWTLDEMIAYADEHPEAELFDSTTKAGMMRYLMMYNEESFIDWSTGECYFDTDAFKSLLNFVNRFEDEVNWDTYVSTPTRIQNGEVLLDTAYFSDFDDIQIYGEIFGNDGYVCIGFPTVDGVSGHALTTGNAYAITAKSSHKDGAWEFIESILTEEENGRYWNGFPTVKTKLDAMIEDAVTVSYILDENGEPYLDEDGNPIVSGGGSSVMYQDGWSYEYHQPTQEDVDRIMAMIDTAKPMSYSENDEVMAIIDEEAEAFYKGQKSVDEVAVIIQNRVNLYVSENNG